MPGFAYDLASSNNFETTFHLTIDYETDQEGRRLGPHENRREFQLGGLKFIMLTSAQKRDRERNPFDIQLMLHDDSLEALADGWTIKGKRTTAWVKEDGTSGSIQTPAKQILNANERSIVTTNFDTNIDKFSFVIQMEFVNVYPHRLSFIDQLLAEERSADCKFLIGEGETVYANRTVLSIDSPVFRAMFNGDFKERKQEAIEMGDLTLNEFLEYLYCIYPPCRPFAFERMETILCLADRFANDVLLISAQKYLLSIQVTDTAMKHQILQWGCQFHLPMLFRFGLSRMNKAELKALDPLKTLKLSMDLMELLVERLLGLD